MEQIRVDGHVEDGVGVGTAVNPVGSDLHPGLAILLTLDSATPPEIRENIEPEIRCFFIPIDFNLRAYRLLASISVMFSNPF